MSSSQDFSYMILQRKLNERFENVLKTDNDTMYIDKNVVPGKKYQYKLLTYDLSGNTSESGILHVTYEPGFRLAPKIKRSLINREEQYFEVYWERLAENYSTYIYLAKDEGKYRLVHTLFNQKESFRFQKLPINHVYRIKIQTMNKEGILSKLSEEVVIEY